MTNIQPIDVYPHLEINWVEDSEGRVDRYSVTRLNADTWLFFKAWGAHPYGSLMVMQCQHTILKREGLVFWTYWTPDGDPFFHEHGVYRGVMCCDCFPQHDVPWVMER